MALSKLFTSLFLFLSCVTTFSQTLNSETRLRKLSLQIRGVPPLSKEYKDLQGKSGRDLENFFDAKADEYLKSNLANAKLTRFLFEDLRIDVSPNYTMENNVNGSYVQPEEANISRKMETNLMLAFNSGVTWDQLFGGQFLMKAVEVSTTTREQIQSRFSNELLLNSFIAAARKNGFTLNTLADIKLALIAYDKDPQQFQTFQFPINEDQARTTLITFFDRFYARLSEDVRLNQNAQKIRNTVLNAVVYADFLPDGTARGNYFGEDEVLKTIKLSQEEILKNICAASILKYIDNGTIRGSNACALPTPYVKVNFPNDIFKRHDIAALILKAYIEKTIVKTEDLLPLLASKLNEPAIILNRPEHDRILSILSTVAVKMQYNKSRYSRPAALFRIFLCDEMKLASVIDESTKSKQAFLSTMGITTGNSTQVMNPSEHAKADCMGCHRKLDPVESVLSRKIQPTESFTFVYDDAEGKEHRIKVKDENELFKVLLEQPQYKSCQVQKFWNWYIGEDMPRSQSQTEALIKKYDELKSEPKQFIRYIVNLPEFYTEEFLRAPPNLQTMRPLLQRCNTCHMTVDTALIPSFTQFPIGDSHAKQLQSIVKHLDIPGAGKNAKMPPRDSGWTLSNDDRNLLLRWIVNGAQDEASKPSLNQAEINEVLKDIPAELIAKSKTAAVTTATLRNTWKRTLKTYDIASTTTWAHGMTNDCLTRIRQSSANVGGIDIQSGFSVMAVPSKGYVSTYSECINRSLMEMRKATSLGMLSRHQGLSQITNPPAQWSEQTEEAKTKIFKDLVTDLIGPNVNHVRSTEGSIALLARAMKAFEQRSPQATFMEGLTTAMYFILNDGAFLTY